MGLSGCSDGSGTGKTEEGKSEEKEGADSQSTQQKQFEIVKLEELVDPKRDTMAGNWIFQFCHTAMTQRTLGVNIPVFIVKIDPKAADKGKLSLVSKHDHLSIVLTLKKLTEKDLDFKFVMKDVEDRKTKKQSKSFKNEFEFSGLRTGNIIRGSLQTRQASQQTPTIASLLATTGKDITRLSMNQMQEGILDLDSALSILQQTGKSEELNKFLSEHSSSPLVFPASSLFLRQMIKSKENLERTQQFVKRYFDSASLWGEKQKHRAMLNMSMTFNLVRFHPQLAFRIAQDLVGDLKKNKALYLAKDLKSFLDQVEDVQRNSNLLWNVQKVHLGTQEEKKQALEELIETNRKDPFNPIVLYAIGSNARRENNRMEAIEYYARIVALPELSKILQEIWTEDRIQRPPIDQSLKQMWKKEKGSLEGLDSYIAKITDQVIDNFVTQEKKLKAIPDRKNVLLELFTGTECQSCVGLDVALTGISNRYPENNVVVLRYHQHSGGANPLANQKSQDRMNYYKSRSAPLLIFNGTKPNYIKSPIIRSTILYTMYEKLLDELLQEKSEISLDLQARHVGDSVEVKASVKAKTLSKDWKLHIVLAEEEIRFQGKNGLKKHEMVVRDVLSKLGGEDVSGGKLEFSRTKKISKIKDELSDALKEYEKKENVEFFDKPLDFKNLHVVAFVQNFKTNEIFQVAHVKVEPGARTTPTVAK